MYNPHKPSREVVTDNVKSRSHVVKYLKNNKRIWHPFKMHLAHELKEDYYELGLEFDEIIIDIVR